MLSIQAQYGDQWSSFAPRNMLMVDVAAAAPRAAPAAAPSPIHIIIAADVSGSMRDMMPIVNAATRFVLANLPKNAAVSMLYFDEEIKILHSCVPSEDKTLQATPAFITRGRKTDLGGAILATLDLAERGQHGAAHGAAHAELLLLTDGFGNHGLLTSSKSITDAVHKRLGLLASSIRMTCVGLSTNYEGFDVDVLRELALMTDGALHSIGTSASVARVMGSFLGQASTVAHNGCKLRVTVNGTPVLAHHTPCSIILLEDVPRIFLLAPELKFKEATVTVEAALINKDGSVLSSCSKTLENTPRVTLESMAVKERELQYDVIQCLASGCFAARTAARTTIPLALLSAIKAHPWSCVEGTMAALLDCTFASAGASSSCTNPIPRSMLQTALTLNQAAYFDDDEFKDLVEHSTSLYTSPMGLLRSEESLGFTQQELDCADAGEGHHFPTLADLYEEDAALAQGEGLPSPPKRAKVNASAGASTRASTTASMLPTQEQDTEEEG